MSDEGTEGQDRESYSDDQDRDSYQVDTCPQCGSLKGVYNNNHDSTCPKYDPNEGITEFDNDGNVII